MVAIEQLKPLFTTFLWDILYTLDGQKNFIGRITNFDPNSEIITLSFDGKTANIELNNVDKARIKPEFKF